MLGFNKKQLAAAGLATLDITGAFFHQPVSLDRQTFASQQVPETPSGRGCGLSQPRTAEFEKTETLRYPLRPFSLSVLSLCWLRTSG